MTAREFARLVNTPYPTVAQWLRDGRVPGAQLQEIGSLKVWLIPKDALKDFKRPDMGRPKPKTASTDGEVSTATDAPDDAMPAPAVGKPTKKAGKKSAKKGAVK